MRYLVTQEIKSETKVMKKIYLFDFFFVIIYMSVSLVLGNLVHPSLQIPFYVFSGIVALTLTVKSYYNKKRRNYESIAILFQRDREVYHPVLNISKKQEEETEEDIGMIRQGERR